jgi:hypothetical protein
MLDKQLDDDQGELDVLINAETSRAEQVRFILKKQRILFG